MGTGNLQFPPDVVADTMFKAVTDFSKANPGTSLKDVRFVLFDKDVATVQVCTDQCVSAHKAQSTQDAGHNAHANSNVFPLMLLACSVDHPHSHQQVPFARVALHVASRVLCGLGLTVPESTECRVLKGRR